MYNSRDVNRYINIKFKTGESPKDYPFVLTSISSNGKLGQLNEYVFQELGLRLADLPDEKDLENGFKLLRYSSVKVLFIVTVDGNSVSESFASNLRAAFRHHINDLNWPMWVPLMGTGAGSLTYMESFRTLAEELERNRGLHGRGIDITVSLPDELDDQSWLLILQHTARNQALNLVKSSYSEVNLDQEPFRSIIEEEEFFLQKARDELERFIPYISDPKKRGSSGGPNPYTEIYDLWLEVKRPLEEEFLGILYNGHHGLAYPFEELLRVLAYIDPGAWRIEKYNEYDPPRFLTSVKPDRVWFLNEVFVWAKMMQDKKSATAINSNFASDLAYLLDPRNFVNILYESHRVGIARHFLNIEATDVFEDELFKYFSFLYDKVSNQANFSYLITAILYHRDYRYQWDESMGIVGDKPLAEQSIEQDQLDSLLTEEPGNISQNIQEEPEPRSPKTAAKGLGEAGRAEVIDNALQRTSLHSDSAHIGQDLLGFQQDIEAFASIITLKELTPPLAIALFGQWGSGKSFFMQKLSEKVEELAETQGFLREDDGSEGAGGEESKPFCEGVCQIQFNAWSYMDTNLWASLVTRIFESLDDYINDNTSDAEEEKNKVKGEIARQLDVAKGQLDELVAKKQQIEDAKEVLKSEVGVAQKDLDDKIDEIKKSSKQVFIEKALSNFKVKEKLQEALKDSEVNLTEGEQLDPDLILKELKSAHSFIKQFLSIKSLNWRWVVPLAIILLIVFFPNEWLGTAFSDWVEGQLDWITKKGATLIAFLGGVIAKVKQTLNKLSPVVNEVLKVKGDYDAAVQEGASNHQQDILAKQIEADQKEVELNQLTLQLKAKEAEIKALEFSSESGLAHKAMYDFITRKAKSSDYTKHLGIISMIRKDFETLSELFVESKETELNKLNKKQREKVDRYNSIRNEFNKPLERIVLYIDDLDRCPEERVVEVLEAVNLLMAFPLFVVVVGVDPRWVKNALIKKYQLQFTGALNGDEKGRAAMQIINPSDYLEKIFQVPFHLMSPSNESIQHMIEHLIGDLVTEEPKTTPDFTEANATNMDIPDFTVETFPEAMPEAEAEPEIASETELEPELAVEEESAEEERAEELGVEEPVTRTSKSIDGDFDIGIPAMEPPKPAPAPAPPMTEAKPLKRVTPESLKLHPAELQYMKDFSWLIGNTPRTVKRFVNMYRIIRAHEGLSYANTDEKEDLMCILFLLALQTGPYQKLHWKIKLLLTEADLLGVSFGEKLRIEKNSQREFIKRETEAFGAEYQRLLKRLIYDASTGALRGLDTHRIFKHCQFIERFRFRTEVVIEDPNLLYPDYPDLDNFEVKPENTDEGLD